MKLKDFLQSTSENINGVKILIGSELQMFKERLCEFDEFKNTNIIKIIEKIQVKAPIIEKTKDGNKVTCETNPELITLKNFDGFIWNNVIELYSIYVQGDDIIIRCTENSIIKL